MIDVTHFLVEQEAVVEGLSLTDFRTVAIGIYGSDPYASSDPDPPAGSRCFIAHEAGRPLARVALFPNRFLSPDASALFLGWYEAPDRPDVSAALFNAVVQYCREIGVRRLIGPINGDTWHRYRIALPSEHPPFFLDVHNPRWYARQFDDAGFRSIAEYYSTRIPAGIGREDRTDRALALFAGRGITVRGVDQNRFDDELRAIHALSLRAFAENFLYSPIGEEEFLRMYAPIRQMADPDFVMVAESAAGELLGFIFALPDLFARDERSMVVKTVAVDPRGEARGLGTFLVELVHRRARERGYATLIHALMHEDNISTNMMTEGSETIRRYRLYEQEV